MNIPEGFNYSDYCSEPSLEMFCKEFIKENAKFVKNLDLQA